MRHIRESVMQDVQSFFHSKGHSPSGEIYEALADIPLTAENIIQGRAKPHMYVCGLDVGTGKTTTLRYTVRAVRKAYPDVGIVLCLGRLDQIETAIKELGLGGQEYAVLVSKDAKTKEGRPFTQLGLGADNINDAPVLITTHAQIETRLQGISWEGSNAFYYRGKSRRLRIWDEAIEMRRHFSISERDIGKVLGADIPKTLRDYAYAILDLLRKAEHRTVVNLPEINDAYDVLGILENLKDKDYREVSHLIRDLVSLSGKQRALIERDVGNSVLLQYTLNLPADLLPLIVLDASARDREVYNEQIEEVEWLKNADKRYDNLTINVKNGPSGKRAFWANYSERLKEAAEIINAHPDRRPLVIHPKETYKWQIGEIQKGIEKHLSGPREVQYLHWGAHDAVNDYADCDLVIALTLYHFPRYAYEIMGRAAANVRVDKDYNHAKVKAVERGEILSHIRQGFGRSCIRKLDGNQAHECVVYVQVPTKGQIKKELKPLFPGCKVANEEGKLDRGEQVLAFVSSADKNKLTFPEIYKSIGMLQPHFSRLIKKPDLRQAVENMGWEFVDSRPSYIERN